jgi:hypothetical protein
LTIISSPVLSSRATEIFANHVETDSDLATAARSLKDGLELALKFTAQYGDPKATSGGSVEGLELDQLTLSAQEMQVTGAARLKSPSPAGVASYFFDGTPDTLQINPGDVLVCYVFIDAADPTTEIMLQFKATDSTGVEHRAYWGANSIVAGINGTPSRWRIGDLPPTGQWVRLEIPANLVDLEGRVLQGMAFSVFDGVCSFDHVVKFPGEIQAARTIITIPPLEILGDSVRTLQPGQKARFQTNYDAAQTPNLVTWSIVSGGGSLSEGEFTAPTAPGTTIIRATSGNQTADLTINVPAIITPGFTVAAPLEQIDWDTNIPPTVAWSSIPAGINTGTGVWIAPNNLGLKVRIQATDGTFTAIRDVLIAEKFPLSNPTAPITVDLNKTVLISESEDRSSVIARVKDKDGLSYQSREVQFLNCELSELEAAIAFWERHFPGS